MSNQWLHRWIPAFIRGKYDDCVSCHGNTHVMKTLPIHLRQHYIEGAGQLCEQCFTLLYPIIDELHLSHGGNDDENQ